MPETEVAGRETVGNEDIYSASQWQLMWMRFKRHRLALIGIVIVCFMYFLALFAEFVAPNHPFETDRNYTYAPPQGVNFVDEEGNFHLRPFVYKLDRSRDPVTLRVEFAEDYDQPLPLRLFVRGEPYELWGLFESDIRFFGVEEGVWFPLGADRMGRCILSRIIYGARISTTIGLIGVILSFLIGLTLGGVSGYFGGALDNIIQRIIEFFMSIPQLPLWMALSAALPAHWPQIRVYFAITVILSIFGWTGLARVVRGKFLALREEDFVTAAELSGTSQFQIIKKHLVPSFLSHILASLTLSIPSMIIGETSLSFLGVGLRPPIVSWGVLLQEAQNLRTIAMAPWLLIPGLFVILTVLAFNFVGDGLRDAADPYST